MQRRLRDTILLCGLIFLCRPCFSFDASLEATAPLNMIPEAERGLEAFVVGLNPADGQYYMLPQLNEPKQLSPEWESLKERLYWLDFENSHGDILKRLPEAAELYVSYPDPEKFPEGHGRAKPYLQQYMMKRAGWSSQRIRQHLHFFKVPTALIWPQDAGEVLGRDARGRLVMAWGPEDWDLYHGTTEALASDFPDRFALKRLAHGVSAEGGDLAVVRRPDGRVGLVIGRHRVLRYLDLTGRGDYKGKPVPQEWIDEARAAYEQSYGMPVEIVPVQALREGWGNEDLFHLDMLAGFLDGTGQARCMVPDLIPENADALSNAAYKDPVLRSLDREYDQVATELARAGYRVTRLPLNDNPVRSPSNTLKYLDVIHHRDVVYLARYPQQMSSAPGSPTAESALLSKFAELQRCADAYNQSLDPKDMQATAHAVGNLRHAMEESMQAPNAAFQAQAQAYRNAGCEVLEIPDYPYGAGGLHCQWLH